jgi:hypothetical protein
VDLVRDLLDTRVVDRNGRDLGRVDGIVLEMRDDAPPRVIGIEVGAGVLAHRIHPLLGRLAVAVRYALTGAIASPVRFNVGDLLDIGDPIKADVAFGETSAAAVEQLFRRWIRVIPGAKR